MGSLRSLAGFLQALILTTWYSILYYNHLYLSNQYLDLRE